MTDAFDLVVLGTGSAGTGVAKRCREAGWRVAIADDRPFGGTCALRGCEPKKALRTVVEAADRVRRLGAMSGLEGAVGVRVNWPAAMAFKRSFTDPVPARRAEDYAKLGIQAFARAGRFLAPDTIGIGDHTLKAKHVLIATGAIPSPVTIAGAEHLLTSDDFLDLETLPRHVLLLGGGYISFEFAHIAVRSGAAVTILHQDQCPLAKFDQDLVARLVAHSRRVGIRIELNAEIERIDKGGDGRVVVHAKDGRSFEGDVAVHGLGRIPNIAQLDLKAGDVAADHGRLKLNRHLRSESNSIVFAAGDAAAKGPALTPIASLDADCVSANLLTDELREPNYKGFGSVVFAIPALAAVGLTEDQARERGMDVEVHTSDMSGYESVRREGHADAGTAYKVILGSKTRAIVGAHLYAPKAEEVINLFALAIRLGLGADDLDQLLSAYPSEGSNIASMLK